MIGIVVVTQLDISSRLIETAERITGKQENLIAVNLKPDESLAHLSSEVLSAVNGCSQNSGISVEGVMVLTDLFGGTPSNASLFQIQDLKLPTEILTGVNLPMLISALVNRNKMGLEELKHKVLTDGQKGIQDAKAILHSRQR